VKPFISSSNIFLNWMVALILSLSFFISSAYPTEPLSFNPQGPISPPEELAVNQDAPSVAMDSIGNAYAIWEDRRGSGYPNIYFAYRPKNGAWEANVRVNDDTGLAVHHTPAIAVDNNRNAYAVWADSRRQSDYHDTRTDIYFAYRPQGGQWQGNVRVSQNSVWAESPAIAVDANGNSYAVWMDSGNIYFSSCPAGGVWQKEEKVNQVSGKAYGSHPRIASAPNGHVMTVWTDLRNGSWDIYSANKPPGGIWKEVIVNNDAGGHGHYAPDVSYIAYPFSTFLAVWVDQRNGSSLYYAVDFFDSWGLFQDKFMDCTNPDRPRVAVDSAGNAYVVWEEFWDIYFTSRTPGIWDAWQPKTKVNDNLSSEAVYHGSSALAVNPADGFAFVLWVDNRNVNNNIYSSFRPAGGGWGENLKVNDNLSGQRVQNFPVALLDPKGNAYVFWVETHSYLGDIYFSRRSPGQNWQPAERVNDLPGKTGYYNRPFAAAIDAGGTLYALWEDSRNGASDLYFSLKTPGGGWQNGERANSPLTQSFNPVLAVDLAGNVSAAWVEDPGGKSDVYFSRRPPGGTWETPEKINDMSQTGINCQYPSLAVGSGGTVYAVWQDNRNGNDGIYFSYRPPNGSWHTNEKVNTKPGEGNQRYPKIAIDDQGNAYVLWETSYNTSDIYFSYRPQSGSWQGHTPINQISIGWRGRPTLAVNPDGGIYAAWQDNHEGISWDVYDIYWSYRPAGGEWSQEVKVNSDPGPFQRFYPSIAVNSWGTVLVAWERGIWPNGAVFYALANEMQYVYLPLILNRP
jgi:hypothetical protein